VASLSKYAFNVPAPQWIKALIDDGSRAGSDPAPNTITIEKKQPTEFVINEALVFEWHIAGLHHRAVVLVTNIFSHSCAYSLLVFCQLRTYDYTARYYGGQIVCHWNSCPESQRTDSRRGHWSAGDHAPPTSRYWWSSDPHLMRIVTTSAGWLSC
jgi:hypothetical protein